MINRGVSCSRRVRFLIARLLVFVYFFASIASAVHNHSHSMGSQGLAKAGCMSGVRNHAALAADSTRVGIGAVDSGCALCDFIGHLVSPAVHTEASCSVRALTISVPQPLVRKQTFPRFCFIGRSASRAPPLA